jgi:hypothetical protein
VDAFDPVEMHAYLSVYARMPIAAGSARWGDLAGASVDPIDDHSFWFAQEYAASGLGSFNYQIALGKINP